MVGLSESMAWKVVGWGALLLAAEEFERPSIAELLTLRTHKTARSTSSGLPERRGNRSGLLTRLSCRELAATTRAGPRPSAWPFFRPRAFAEGPAARRSFTQ